MPHSCCFLCKVGKYLMYNNKFVILFQITCVFFNIVFILDRFINLNLEMDEYIFLSMHQGVAHTVISKAAFKEIMGMFKLSTFARKMVKSDLEHENTPEVPQAEGSTSYSIESGFRKETIRSKGKGKGKAKKKKC